MSASFSIEDGEGSKREAKVTELGQLVTGALSYDSSVFNSMAVVDTGNEFYEPIAQKQFVITGIRGKAARDVSNTTDAVIIIYEASAPDTTTVDKVLHEEALIRGEDFTLLPTNILVNPGKWVLGKTSDATIFMTIFGYYIDKLEQS